MFEELMGAFGGRLVVAVLGVGLALLCLVGILWIVRGRNGPSPFVRGGRNRQPRLQVLDAAAVDTRRRLVLVRRDDVEHLIMIGGPTDIVIESRIPPSHQASAPRPGEPQAPAAATLPAAPKPVAGDATKPIAPPAQPVVHPAAQPALQARAEMERTPLSTEPRAPAPTPSAPSIPQQPAVAAPPARTIAATRPEPKMGEASTPVPAAAQAPAAPLVADMAVADHIRRPDLSTAKGPALDDASKLLDTARERVFAERAPAAPVAQRPSAPVGDSSKALGSEFEKILEAEMANNLAARDAAVIGRTVRPLPQSGPAVAIPDATRNDPSLQSEVARIFGEMSASRDK